MSRSAAVHPGVHAAVTMALELSRHVMRIRVVGGAPGYVSIPLDIDDGSRPCMYEDLP